MSTNIPLRSDLTYYDLRVPLDGVTYTLQVKWNPRLGAWFMDVLDETGQIYYQSSLRLVVNWPLAAYNVGRKPPGLFVAIDTSGAGLDPGNLGQGPSGGLLPANDLGTRVKLNYYSKAELGI